eukprot:TRINITY_DN5091_c3_g3_i1.p1 TRINITY_DN5091_c3_g3~~TRINITY_DN5091_c3_g3_i1.p1  ORF type:complete len:1581 (+),score=562.87 TRINITY_DN5091_c3_g3_i1:79-4743(+)
MGSSTNEPDFCGPNGCMELQACSPDTAVAILSDVGSISGVTEASPQERLVTTDSGLPTDERPSIVQCLLSIRWLTVALCLVSIVLCASLATFLVVESADRALDETNHVAEAGLKKIHDNGVMSEFELGNRLMNMIMESGTSFVQGTLQPVRLSTASLNTYMLSIDPDRLLTWDFIYAQRTRLWAALYASNKYYTGMGVVTAGGQMVAMVEDDVTVGNPDYSSIMVLMNNGSEFGDPTNRTVQSWARPWDGDVVGNRLPGRPQDPGGLAYAPSNNLTEAKCECFQYGFDQSTHPDWCGRCTYYEHINGLCTPKTRGYCTEPTCLSKGVAQADSVPSHNTSFVYGMCPRPFWGPFDVSMWLLGYVGVPTNSLRWSPPTSLGPYVGLLLTGAFLHHDAATNASQYIDGPRGPRSGITFVGFDSRSFSQYLSTEIWRGQTMGKARVFLCLRSDGINGRALEGTLLGVSHGQPARLASVTYSGPVLVPILMSASDDEVLNSTAAYILSRGNGTTSGWDVVHEATSGSLPPIEYNATHNGTAEAFFLKMRRMTDEYHLDLWIGLALDRYFVHGELEKRTAEVTEEIRVSREHVDEDLFNERVRTFLIVAAVAMVLMVVCAVLCFAIVRPLDLLAADMELVARLHLEGLSEELNHLAEVRRLQRSFLQMVRFLKEWKAFVPTDALLGADEETMAATVFPADESGAEETSSEEAAADAADPDREDRQLSVRQLSQSGIGHALIGSQASNTAFTPRSPGGPISPTLRFRPPRSLMSRLQDTATLRFRRGSIMLAELYASLHCDSKPLEHPHGSYTASRELSGRMSKLLSPVLDAAAAAGGTVLLIGAERCFLTWNIFKSRHDYPLASCRASLAMAARIRELDQEQEGQQSPWWSLSIGTGGCFVGNVGNDGRRAPIVVSSSLALINALSRLAPRIRSRILVSDKLHRVVGALDSRAVDLVPEVPVPDAPGPVGRGAQLTRVYELLESDPLSPRSRRVYSSAFSAMCTGDFSKAREGFVEVLQRQMDHHSRRLLRIVMLRLQEGAAVAYFRGWRVPWEDHEGASAQVDLPAELNGMRKSSSASQWGMQHATRGRVPSMSEAQLLEDEIKRATGLRAGMLEADEADVGQVVPRISPLQTPLHRRTPQSSDSSLLRRGGARPLGRRIARASMDSESSSHTAGVASTSSALPRAAAAPAAQRRQSGSTASRSPAMGGLRPSREVPRMRAPIDSDSLSDSSKSSGGGGGGGGGAQSVNRTHHSMAMSSCGEAAVIPREFSTGRGAKEAKWYRGDRCLGRGAFGEVWLAMGDAGQLVALKVLPLPTPAKKRQNRGLRNIVDRGMSKEELQSLVQEVSLMTRLRHDNIVWFLASGVVNRNIVIVMEYLPGGSLHGLLGEFGALQLGPARRYINDMLDGLAFLHGEEIVHRDLKPANVLLTIEGQCKLADFGASGELASKSKPTGIAGTPLYMAPEAVRQAGLKPSDMWSLGITVIQLIAGHLPYSIPEQGFSSVWFMRRLEKGDLVPEIPAALPPTVTDLVMQCLRHDPAARPTAEQLRSHEFMVDCQSA